MHVLEIVSMLLVVALSMIVRLPDRHDHCICNYFLAVKGQPRNRPIVVNERNRRNIHLSLVHFVVLAPFKARALDVHSGPQESRMPAWKVLIVAFLAIACLTLGFATLIVPMTMTTGGERWMWLGGLLVATAIMGTLFALFLRRASAAMR